MLAVIFMRKPIGIAALIFLPKEAVAQRCSVKKVAWGQQLY